MSFYGLEDEFITFLKIKIKHTKQRKGRGVMVSYHAFNEDLRLSRLCKLMHYGLTIGLVSDAGTPSISDPGDKLVSACLKENIEIEALPGSSAVITALSGSGFPAGRFFFEGFLPKV